MIVTGIVCPLVYITVIVAPGVPPFNQYDIMKLRYAETRCRVVVGPQSPCLKKFTKVDQLTYTAICGKKDK